MKTKTNQVPDPDLDEALIAQYLRHHPDFFARHGRLLADMTIPHQAGGAVSLVERQVTLLRERQMATQKQLDDYITAARINDAIFSKSQKLILALIKAAQPEAFFTILEHSFRHDFTASAYRLLVLDNNLVQHKGLASISEDAARKHIGAIMKRRKPRLGVLQAPEKTFLFGRQSSRVQSAMVLSITSEQKVCAILAVGSDDKHYFSSNMGALFVGFIAETLSLLLPKHLIWKPE